MAPNGSIDDLPKRLARFDAASCETEEARAELLAAARTLCQRLEKPMETLLRIAWIDTSHTACLKIGIDVGLFEALGEVGKGATYSVEELAKTTSVEKELLGRKPIGS